MTTDAPPAEHADPFPPPPRAVTPLARRRSWTDPHVRFWWLAAAALLLAGLYLLTVQLLGWWREVRLVRHGTPVAAVVVQANEQTLPGRPQRPDAIVRMEFDWRGQKRTATGRLEGRRSGQFIAVGDKVSLRVDPADPQRWTARTEPPPLAIELLGGLITLALAAAVAPAAFAARGRVLRTWRDGHAAEAQVVARQQTALAPRSMAVRCTLPADGGGGSDDRVFTVYVPGGKAAAAAAAADGEFVWVLLHPKNRPLAVAWFE